MKDSRKRYKKQLNGHIPTMLVSAGKQEDNMLHLKTTPQIYITMARAKTRYAYKPNDKLMDKHCMLHGTGQSYA